MKIYEKITDLIGRTPIMKLNNYSAAQGLDTPVLAKLEYFNPAGSVNDCLQPHDEPSEWI